MKPTDTYNADQDAALEGAVRVSLQGYYGLPPDAATLWSKVASNLPSRDTPRRRSVLHPLASESRLRRRRSPFPRIALAAFLLFAVGASTYSAVELLRPLLHVPAAEGRHYSQIGEAKTAGDITVVIEQAVADQDVIIIGVGGSRPCALPLPACQFYFDATQLTVNGAKVTPHAIESDGAYRPGKQEEAYVLYYTPPKLAEEPAILNMHLDIRVMSDANPDGTVLSFDFTLPNGAASRS